LNLAQWLEYLEQCHPSNIELGLERISTVAAKLPIGFDGSKIITVAGTNGKGSTVSMLSAILEQGGYSTCCYTSPHILQYNERVKLGNRFATDEELCESFAAVEAFRGDIKLTYFEFGTLAALQIFSRYKADYIILEIGLGGRLDAVNILDPDLAILTNVALDHTDWLGDTREAIGFEKAGIFRTAIPALIGEKDIPESVTKHADSIGATVYANGIDFNAEQKDDKSWQWQGASTSGDSISLNELPLNDYPLDNCATVVQAISLLAPEITTEQLKSGLMNASLPGRFQYVQKEYALILDVAHNPHAAKRFVEQVKNRFPGKKISIVLAMLADKNYQEVVDCFRELKPVWYVASIKEERGLEGKILYNYLRETEESTVNCFSTITEAYTAADNAITAANLNSQQYEDSDAVLLVTGSFFTVSAVLELI